MASMDTDALGSEWHFGDDGEVSGQPSVTDPICLDDLVGEWGPLQDFSEEDILERRADLFNGNSDDEYVVDVCQACLSCLLMICHYS